MIQLTRTGTVFSGSPGDLEQLRLRFDRQHWIRLPQLLEPGLLQLILYRIERADFSPLVHSGIGTELCMRDQINHGLLNFLANDPKLYAIVQQITGCSHIGSFHGRVYRMIPGGGHCDSWHDDMVDHRLVSLSLNLSSEVYAGGVLQMRDRKLGQIVVGVANTGSGDAILFRLSQHLEHRVTEVVGAVPKTAFAGWFQSQPDFHASLREKGSLEDHRNAGEPRRLSRSLAQ